MKTKLLFTLIIGMLLADLGFGQTRIGFRASGSMTNITEVHMWSKSRFGYQLAAFAEIPISNNYIWYFQPEINYSGQGEFDQPIADDGTHKRQKVYLSYINVPLNVKVFFTDDFNEFFALGGPYLGFRVSKNIQDVGYPTEAERNEFNDFDFGVTLGIGFSLDRKIEWSIRYSYGLADQVKNDYKDDTNRTSILNLGMSFILD